MRIVVTGGAGFICKRVLEWLAANGHIVRLIDDFSTGRPSHVSAGVAVAAQDLTMLSAPDVAAILRNFGAGGIIHLAAMHFIPDCMARPERTFDVKTRVTHTLTEALRNHPVERIVMASTMEVYGIEYWSMAEGRRRHPPTSMACPSC